MMPGIGGFAVLHSVRGSAPNANTPVIMVSADKDAIESCLAAGANAYLVKPVKRAELVSALKKQLAARSGRA